MYCGNSCEQFHCFSVQCVASSGLSVIVTKLFLLFSDSKINSDIEWLHFPFF